MRALSRIFVAWLPLGIAITGVCLIVYVSTVHIYQSSFYEPQIQIAEDAAARLASGVPELMFDGVVDIRTSLAPFILIYDIDGRHIGGNAILDGNEPMPPKEAFDDVGYWRWGRTWQPDEDVRVAAVIVPFSTEDHNTGYILVGRNMRVMQDHANEAGTKIFSGWFVLLIATFLAKGFARYLS